MIGHAWIGDLFITWAIGLVIWVCMFALAGAGIDDVPNRIALVALTGIELFVLVVITLSMILGTGM